MLMVEQPDAVSEAVKTRLRTKGLFRKEGER